MGIGIRIEFEIGFRIEMIRSKCGGVLKLQRSQCDLPIDYSCCCSVWCVLFAGLFIHLFVCLDFGLHICLIASPPTNSKSQTTNPKPKRKPKLTRSRGGMRKHERPGERRKQLKCHKQPKKTKKKKKNKTNKETKWNNTICNLLLEKLKRQRFSGSPCAVVYLIEPRVNKNPLENYLHIFAGDLFNEGES